jgi:hypothetical protein
MLLKSGRQALISENETKWKDALALESESILLT